METPVFFLGMHGSGTSALTRCVNLLGVASGRAGDLMDFGMAERFTGGEHDDVEPGSAEVARVACDVRLCYVLNNRKVAPHLDGKTSPL